MEGLKKITDHIHSDSESEAAELLIHAREDAHAKHLHYQRAAEATRRQILARGEARADEEMRRSVSAAELEARKTLLAVKQELVSEVFSKAMQQLSALTADEYLSFLIRQAVKASLTGCEEIVLNAADREAYGKVLTTEANRLLHEAGRTGALTLSPETAQFSGGLVLRSGLIETNCTWESLLKQAHDTLTGDAASILFETR